MKAVFWLSLCMLLYTWIGYPVFLAVVAKIGRRRALADQSYTPSVTVLLTVYNEERIIASRIRNLLDGTYPADCMEILLASDGSNDRTDLIVDELTVVEPRIRLMKTMGGGKSATQNIAISYARGDIIVLTDADTLFEQDTINQLVKNFVDDKVGCASGTLVLKNTNSTIGQGQGLYWCFEMNLRRLESAIGVFHTASGSVMAFRKDLFRQFDSKYGDDCIIPLDIIQQGYRVVHEDAAIAYDSFPSSLVGELRSRTRMTLRNITCTLSKYQLLNPFKYPLVSLAIVSHKLLRWLTPFFMLAAFFTNILLISDGTFFFLTGSAQCFFYILALLGFVGERFNVRIPFASQIFSFVLANVGFFLGVMKAILGKRVTSYKNHRSCHGG